MSLQLPKRAASLAAVGIGVLALGGCSKDSQGEWERFAMPDPASAQGEHTLDLWQGAWWAALITGVIVWALIFWAIFKFRRRSDDEIPVQTRYNLPLEIFYTIAPIIMVIVFFAHTVETQNFILDEDSVSPVENTIEITGQQWSWTFNYGVGEMDRSADDELMDDTFAYDKYAFVSGTGSNIPTLVLPVDVTTRFNLHSPDVIHDFGVPAFIMKMDVVPGRVNHYTITPTTEGTYAGKCYELCGAYHSRMLFSVEVVSQEKYDAYVQHLVDAGATSDLPLIGGEEASTQAGLVSGESEEDAE